MRGVDGIILVGCLAALKRFDPVREVIAASLRAANVGAILAVRHSGADFELNHFLLIRIQATGAQNLRRLFVVVSQEFATDRRHLRKGRVDAQSSHAHVRLVYALIADVAVAATPVPVA